MEDLLKKYKKTKATTESTPVMQIHVESINIDVLVYNILQFKVGDFTQCFGTTEITLMYRESIPIIPPEFELRVRGLNSLQFTMFYPTGYLVWNKLLQYDTEGMEFKAQALVNEKQIPYIKIWRSK
jgi:hypothetical protein